MKLNKTYILFILFTVLFTTCRGFKSKATKGGKGYYTSFFIGQDTTQYFIEPIMFTKKEKIEVDFTFRKLKNKFSPVTMNFSVFRKDNIQIDSIYFVANGEKQSLDKKKILFKEKVKKYYKYRYSLQIPYKILEDFFSDENVFFVLEIQHILPQKKTKKIIKLLYRDLFNFELKD